MFGETFWQFYSNQFAHQDISLSVTCTLWASIFTLRQNVTVHVTVSWWSSGYDAHPEFERLGFDSLLRHWFFRIISWRQSYFIYECFTIKMLLWCDKLHMLLPLFFRCRSRHNWVLHCSENNDNFDLKLIAIKQASLVAEPEWSSG